MCFHTPSHHDPLPIDSVALNEQGAGLHYTELGRLPPKPVRSFLIDAGASHGGYASDITRTYSADTGDEFQSLVDAVDAAQLGMCAQVRAGADCKQLHLDAPLEPETILTDAGVLRVAAEIGRAND